MKKLLAALCLILCACVNPDNVEYSSKLDVRQDIPDSVRYDRHREIKESFITYDRKIMVELMYVISNVEVGEKSNSEISDSNDIVILNYGDRQARIYMFEDNQVVVNGIRFTAENVDKVEDVLDLIAVEENKVVEESDQSAEDSN